MKETHTLTQDSEIKVLQDKLDTLIQAIKQECDQFLFPDEDRPILINALAKIGNAYQRQFIAGDIVKISGGGYNKFLWEGTKFTLLEYYPSTSTWQAVHRDARNTPCTYYFPENVLVKHHET